MCVKQVSPSKPLAPFFSSKRLVTQAVGLPDVTAKALGKLTADFVHGHFNLGSLPAIADARLFRPLYHGGMGLMSIAAAAAPAVAASWQLVLPRLLEELNLADAKALQMYVPRLGSSLTMVQRFLQKQRRSTLPAPTAGPSAPKVAQQALMRAQTTREMESWHRVPKPHGEGMASQLRWHWRSVASTTIRPLPYHG